MKLVFLSFPYLIAQIQEYDLWNSQWIGGSDGCCDVGGGPFDINFAIDGRTEQWNQIVGGLPQLSSFGITKSDTTSAVYQVELYGGIDFVTTIKVFPWYGSSPADGYIFNAGGGGFNFISTCTSGCWADHMQNLQVKLINGGSETICTVVSCDVSTATECTYKCNALGDTVQLSNVDGVAFREIEVQSAHHISTLSVRGVADAIDRRFNVSPSTDDSIYTHGCWCSKLAEATTVDVWGRGGMNYMDGVDEICKDWMQARKCHQLEFGVCYNGGVTPLSVNEYTYQIYTTDAGVHTCVETSGCRYEICQIDEYFLNLLDTETSGVLTNAAGGSFTAQGSTGNCALGQALTSCDACCGSTYNAKCYNRAIHSDCCSGGLIITDFRTCVTQGNPTS